MPNPQKVVLYHKAQNLLFDFVNSIGIQTSNYQKPSILANFFWRKNWLKIMSESALTSCRFSENSA